MQLLTQPSCTSWSKNWKWDADQQWEVGREPMNVTRKVQVQDLLPSWRFVPSPVPVGSPPCAMKSGKIKPSKCVSKVSKNIGLQSTCVHSGVSREYYRNKIHSLTEKVVSQARISQGKSESDRQDYRKGQPPIECTMWMYWWPSCASCTAKTFVAIMSWLHIPRTILWNIVPL